MLCARAGADPVIVDQMWKCSVKDNSAQWNFVFARVSTDNVWSVIAAEVYVQNKDGTRINQESLGTSTPTKVLTNGDITWTGKSFGTDVTANLSNLYLTLHEVGPAKITGNADYYNPKSSKYFDGNIDCDLL